MALKKFDQINVIPFIDIMLVALAIILLTATFISHGIIEINLPTASNAETKSQLPSIEISIDVKQQFYYQQQPHTLEKMAEQLKKLSKQTPIILKIDQSVSFGRFTQLIDLLKTYQLDHLSIMTLPK
ncbi:biopolymer transporter ExbD [Candidatus Parabeggiatoa sp. HSG14]|uniref:biopolymer transporter ExbD n=1 Tax=Candidatus Parabeggiatoa sp. HSG14 TaxID=3055593 RepID=UPI0025A760EB|nr:biopolymer transporter ExbD [Thiotrichales bacterium HSG14]